MIKKTVIILGVIVFALVIVYPFIKTEKDPNPTPFFLSNPTQYTFRGNSNEFLSAYSNDQGELKITVDTKSVKKMELYYDDSLIKKWVKPKETESFLFNPGMFGVGVKSLNILSILNDGNKFVDNKIVTVFSSFVPEKKVTRIIRKHPHNTKSFTQGLEFYKGNLFEGTGDPGDQGNSIIAIIDLNTGFVEEKKELSLGFFGEGITILDDKAYQLTWKNQKCFVYDLQKGFQLQKEFDYTGEGWGLCNNGVSLIMSNGTQAITFRNPETFQITKKIEVYNNKGPINYINELEFIDGEIYANVWTTNTVVVIDPETGVVLQEIDATNLIKEGQGFSGGVLNGIAHNKQTNKTYMTGKNWSGLLEVEFLERDAVE